MMLRKAGDAPEHKTIVVSVLGLLSLASCQSQVCNRCPLRGHHRRRHRRRQGCCRHHRRRDRCRCCYVVLVIVVAVVTDVVLLLVLFVLVLLLFLFLFLVLVLNIIQCHHPLATTPKISGSALKSTTTAQRMAVFVHDSSIRALLQWMVPHAICPTLLLSLALRT